MARIPKYSLHKGTGQARIWIGGRHVYLGKFGSKESKERYAKLITQQESPLPELDEQISVIELVNHYWQDAKTRYFKNGRKTSEHQSYAVALRPVIDRFAEVLAANFGPRMLLECRKVLIELGYCRKRINGHVYRIRRIWKWGVSRELVPETTWRALLSVEGLRYGEARETEPVRPVPEDHIEAVKPFVTAQIKTMIELQLLTAARPGEICIMRPADIRQAGDIWEYQPSAHKTQHHEKSRLIFLGPKAQSIVKEWMTRGPECFLFRPTDARAAWLQRVKQRAVGLKKKKAKPRRLPGEFYETSAYGHAIRRACKRAGIPVWSPNRLRHNAATRIRSQFGAEAAQIILGHSELSTTEIYAERDVRLAHKVASELG